MHLRRRLLFASAGIVECGTSCEWSPTAGCTISDFDSARPSSIAILSSAAARDSRGGADAGMGVAEKAFM